MTEIEIDTHYSKIGIIDEEHKDVAENEIYGIRVNHNEPEVTPGTNNKQQNRLSNQS